MFFTVVRRKNPKTPAGNMKNESFASALRRLSNLRERLAQKKIDALLVVSLPNVHYLTGFSGSAGVLLVTLRNSILFTDSRYDLQAQREVCGSRVVIAKGGALAAAVKWAARTKPGRLGFESESISFGSYRNLRELIVNKKLVPTVRLVESLRMQKDKAEIEQIRKAVQLGSKAFSDTIAHLRPGITEIDVAAEIEYRMRRLGAERLAFETIVAAGPNTALPHARPGTRKLKKNECIMLDLGAILGGYAGDMTRTIFLGQAPPKASRIYKAVLEAQKEAEQAVQVGVPCSAVDKAARKVLERYGYGSYFTHSTGHGVGREIHEMPSLARNQETLLPESAVVTVEPGVYIPGYGGVRIENVVVVRKQGPEILTTTPRELTVL